MRVTIVDIEPIDPPVGGSRLRLKGLFHALGADIEATYVGAFHWRGPAARRFRHSPTLEEITIPFSEAHFLAVEELGALWDGTGMIDATFPRFGTLSPDFCREALAAIDGADVVVFSHPWIYAIGRVAIDAAEAAGRRPLVLYDAHNVEGLLRRTLLDGTAGGRQLADEAEALEHALCEAADLVLCCSHEDRMTFVHRYGIPATKTRLVPSGGFCADLAPAAAPAHAAARAALGLGRQPVAMFMGNLFPPNVEAATFICDRIAPACPDVTFAIIGSCGDPLAERRDAPLPPNVRLPGKIEEAAKQQWLAAADMAINPMFSGSGTNVKMFDFMAAGLPIVTTPFGARGIERTDAFAMADAGGFASTVASVAADRDRRRELGRRARALCENSFDWATISAELGAVMRANRPGQGPAPLFSVLIPTLDRREKLIRLLDLLSVQRERAFEVVVVDQSATPVAIDLDFGFPLTVIHSRVRGAARARNVAAAAARGSIFAFTDDDCEPSEVWLSEARLALARPEFVGLEGRVYSDRLRDPAWRSVHNYGAEGAGYMTCNLFARAETFHRLNGFDTAFDAQHFREDTDFGWRLEAAGRVAFSERAFIYHPPWSRTIPRESDQARNQMFEIDALLMQKHPERYRTCFLREGHWRKGAAFWEPFLRGVQRLGVALPDYIQAARREAEAVGRAS